MDDILLTDIRDGVATLTLNRPRQMNALSAELRRRFGEALEALGKDQSVAVVIITGAGEKAFTAGVDLKELETAPLTDEELGPDGPVNRAFRALGKPTIAAVNGFAITGGMELAINCDILVASTHARFADTHARVGIVPGWGMSQLLPRHHRAGTRPLHELHRQLRGRGHRQGLGPRARGAASRRAAALVPEARRGDREL